jgi:DNA-binding XRE family transcriptional regulator
MPNPRWLRHETNEVEPWTTVDARALDTPEHKLWKQARRALGFTHQQLADRLGVTRQAVSSWELGNVQPSDKHLAALADQLAPAREGQR